MFNLRNFRHADFDKLHKLDQICFPPAIAYSQSELRSYLERGGAWSVVAEQIDPPEAEGAATQRPPIAGFLVMELDARGLGHVITIDVAPRCRRQGLGRTMLDAAIAELKRRNCFMMVLEVAVNNIAAIGFYKKLGFSVVKTMTGYYNGKIDGMLLTKRL